MLLSVPKIHTDLLWVLTMVFSGLGILYFFFVFILRNRISAKASKIASKKKILGPMISNFLFFETDSSKEEKSEYIKLKIEIRELLKEPFNRAVLAEILLDLQKDVSGDARKRLFKIYQDLDLHLDAFEKLKSWRWEVVSKGILELTQMQVSTAYGFIKKFINHKKGVIRKQAQIATVSLKHEGIGYFLDTARFQISEWQQLKLLEVLRNIEDFDPPRFKAWLTSKNKDVVLFALRLIKYYNQNDADAALVELVKHKNDQVRSEAIQCVKEFNVYEALDVMKAVFRKSKVETKIQILDTMASLGKDEDLVFLERIARKSSNFLVKSKAISTINEIAPGTFLPTEGIDKKIPTQNFKNNVESSSTQLPEVMDDNESQQEANAPASGKNEESLEFEDYLNADQENEIIFDLCFMEELQDILDEYDESEEEVNVLPLDFLPVVSEGEEIDPDTGAHIENEENEAEDEEKFRKELETILATIKSPEEDVPADPVETELGFIPIVVETEVEEQSENPIESSDEAILLIEVNEMEVVEAEEISNLYSGNRETLIIPEPELEGYETKNQNSIDWKAFTTDSGFAFNAEYPTTYGEKISNEDKDDGINENSSPDIEFKGFSIFQELFRSCDTESKLILLDEILAVGDEKEVHFLKTLSNDSNKKVRAKAEVILKELLEVLAPEEEIETNDFIKDTENTPFIEEEKILICPEKSRNDSDLSQEIDTMKPLEHCFLEVGDHKDDEDLLFELDFEPVDSSLEELQENSNPNEAVVQEQVKKEEKLFDTLIRNIKLFPQKLKGKTNG